MTGDLALLTAPGRRCCLLEKNTATDRRYPHEKDSGASFHGDGVRYHVFSYQYEDYIDLMFAWSPVEFETNYYPTTSKAAEAWLDEIDVPADKRPDYAKCGSRHKSQEDNSEIIFFWDDELNRLYIIENFI